MTAALLTAENLTKLFSAQRRGLTKGRSGSVHAVDGVSFDLPPGETVAIVGESGCGKSTTARMLLRLDRPTAGLITYRGEDIWALSGDELRQYRRGIQAVFQDPSSALSPRRRVRDIVVEPLIVTEGLPSRTARSRAGELLATVGLSQDVGARFPHQLSGGMKQRVAIAHALATRPEAIILDEPVSALDVSTSADILNLLREIQDQFGVSYLLITHDLSTVRFLAHKVVAMYLGKIAESGTSESIFSGALHPYTLALMSASIPDDGSSEHRERIILQGEIPSPVDPPKGCRFQSRCWLTAQLGSPEVCRTDSPAYEDLGAGHYVSCHFLSESRGTELRTSLLGALGARDRSVSEDR